MKAIESLNVSEEAPPLPKAKEVLFFVSGFPVCRPDCRPAVQYIREYIYLLED